MKDRILHILHELRTYALGKGYRIALFFQEEDSSLMRFANSAISLNTNEHLVRLDITAYAGRKRASNELITDLSHLDEMKDGIDLAAAMAELAQPLNYQPTVPLFTETTSDDRGYDAALAQMSSDEKLQYFNKVAAILETGELRLSGIFSSGITSIAQISTSSEHTQFFKITDAQVTVVLAHSTLKWEVQAEQSAQRKSDLHADQLQAELVFLVEHYAHDPALQLPLGRYDIVFGPAATADLVHFMNWIGFNGGLMRRGFSFLNEKSCGQKVFSEHFTLVDDPSRLETFPLTRDFNGLPRKAFPLFENGVFQNFAWLQDDADEFGEKPTGHTVSHKSLVLSGGMVEVKSLQELVAMRCDTDLLYIPFLHYMNIVNPSKGVVTASSRFGALLLKKDGTVAIPFNVRLTQSLLDIFGEKLAWMSKETIAYNQSISYRARNPTAMIVPRFIRVNNLEISGSNPSY